MAEAAAAYMPSQLRHLYALIFSFNAPSDLLHLYEQFEDQQIKYFARGGTRELARQRAILEINETLLLYGMCCNYLRLLINMEVNTVNDDVIERPLTQIGSFNH